MIRAKPAESQEALCRFGGRGLMRTGAHELRRWHLRCFQSRRVGGWTVYVYGLACGQSQTPTVGSEPASRVKLQENFA